MLCGMFHAISAEAVLLAGVTWLSRAPRIHL
jgi:hypothetical protein